MDPYIGVTGFTKPDQIGTVIGYFPINSPRKFMVGALASSKSLRGARQKPKWQKQTPNYQVYAELFWDDPNAFNLIHYSTDAKHESSLAMELVIATAMGGPNLHGFQLNIAWPDSALLQSFFKAMSDIGRSVRIILQISEQAVQKAGDTPAGVVAQLACYEGLIEGILFDQSSGEGKAFDFDQAFAYLSAIQQAFPNLGIGIAGGLGPQTVERVAPLVTAFPNLSIDAQSGVRDAANNLDIAAMRAYIVKAQALFA